jgi:rod shape determining protein RodA
MTDRGWITGVPGRVGASVMQRFGARYDWTLIGTALFLCAIGLVNLYSATHRTPNSGKFDNQVVWMLIALPLLFFVGFIDYRNWSRLAWPGVLVAIGSLIMLEAFAVVTPGGAGRWLSFGPIRVQPSEITKIAVIIALARLLEDAAERRLGAGDVAFGIVALLTPMALIATQPDLGTSIMVGMIVMTVVLLMVRVVWPLLAGMALFAVAGAIFWHFFWDKLLRYQQNRIEAFLDPGADPTGIGWQTQQSIFAVGSGRITGKGFLNATQNHFNFLPEYWTDFPFSVWAEEWGLVGSLLVIALYIWLVGWIVNVAVNARDTFGCAVAVGVGALIFWQTIVNLLMVLGMAPVVGVTLPLISYGGSSLITVCFGIGLVSSISVRRKR